MSTITCNHGSEGLAHDLYSYEEFTVERANGATATLHHGLTWYVIFQTPEMDHPVRLDFLGFDDKANKELETDILLRSIGLDANRIERAWRCAKERPYREHRKHGGFQWSGGFPGEHLCWCKCGALIDSSFDLSAIE